MGGQDRPDGRGAESFARKRQYDYHAVGACIHRATCNSVHELVALATCSITLHLTAHCSALLRFHCWLALVCRLMNVFGALHWSLELRVPIVKYRRLTASRRQPTCAAWADVPEEVDSPSQSA